MCNNDMYEVDLGRVGVMTLVVTGRLGVGSVPEFERLSYRTFDEATKARILLSPAYLPSRHTVRGQLKQKTCASYVCCMKSVEICTPANESIPPCDL